MIKVFIVGLPRTGTSFLANLIKEMGFSLGNYDSYIKFEDSDRKGYAEHMRLNSISNNILEELGYDYFFNLPESPIPYSNSLRKYLNQIIKISNEECVEAYKDNKLIAVSDVFHTAFPNAKWVYIRRDINATYKSRWGNEIDFDKWAELSSNRESLWRMTSQSKVALNLDYDDFLNNPKSTISGIAKFLNVDTLHINQNSLTSLFQPR